MGFEPTELLHSLVFKTSAFIHSAISPYILVLFLSDNQKPTHPCGGWQVKGVGNFKATVAYWTSKRDSNPPKMLGRHLCYHYITTGYIVITELTILHSNLVLRLLEPHRKFLPRLELLTASLFSIKSTMLSIVNLHLVTPILLIDVINCVCPYAIKLLYLSLIGSVCIYRRSAYITFSSPTP